jgi:hypothetical protein
MNATENVVLKTVYTATGLGGNFSTFLLIVLVEVKGMFSAEAGPYW